MKDVAMAFQQMSQEEDNTAYTALAGYLGAYYEFNDKFDSC